MKYYTPLFAFGLLLAASCQKKEEKTESESVIKEVITETAKTPELPESGKMCFLQIVSKDTLSLTIDKNGDNVKGTYRSVPYEKDKRTIVFEGNLNGNTVTAVGSAMGEGQTQKEEIIFTLENNQAGIKFGEMIQGDDGVYRYKNKNSATPLYINKVECN
ncbi:hypothetical protein R1T16_02495 [Flavobacterium sp. DG1-102-2]|uniref:hypothetical protein n=1 Tax=Flavobacterium sp. DG1-102-2 TaxID=3081663 RepID=UPI002949B2F0|nr:hypothetical protein [Flavobacterium sp. DG1-102-2]MDV6167276.1 hypothetical protein [Flavobacterium sp. DG1-102-2]